MKIWGITMVRDEADIIELTLRHMTAQGVDGLLVADNLSRDGTSTILERLRRELPLTVVPDEDPAYRQSEKMTALAERVHALGADWVVPFDADEIWRPHRGAATIREAIEGSDASILVAPMFDHFPRPTLRRGSIVDRMPWNRPAEVMGMKVAVRWQPGAHLQMGNHDVDGIDGARIGNLLLIDHYPFRSWRQFRRKNRQGREAIQLTDEPAGICYHWRDLGGTSDTRLRVSWWQRRLRRGLVRSDRRDLLPAPDSSP
jgi:hypothetical protein